MSPRNEQITSPASLLCSYAELKKWEYDGVDEELLTPSRLGAEVVALVLNPLEPNEVKIP